MRCPEAEHQRAENVEMRVRLEERREYDRSLDDAAVHYAAVAGDDPSGRAARERFVMEALPFADRVAGRYHGRGAPLDDLRQVARLGLIKAIDNLDPARGSFTAYAAITMRGELRRYFRDNGWAVHVPRPTQELTLEMWKVREDLTRELHRPPTRPELAARLRATPADLEQALQASGAWSTRSLSAVVRGQGDSDGGSAELGELLGERDADLDSVDDRLTMRKLVAQLPAREQKILALRFYGNLSQVEIAKATGVSQMHVSRLLTRALTWLREAMLSDVAPPWPGLDNDADLVGLAVDVTQHNGEVTVAIRGEVDCDNADELRRQLEFYCRHARTAVRVDLGRVPFVDAAGFTGLARCYQVAHQRRIQFHLCHVNATVLRGLRVARLGHLVVA
jgi:RNA polymerase sigma-B factor